MTLSSIVALFGAMLTLAVIPSPSVFAVVARSISSGFTQGLVTVMGIVTGDFIFILLAVSGLSAMAETMGGLFVWVKYAGAAYLLWLGIGVWRSKVKAVTLDEAIRPSAWGASFMSGLLITLSDPKAVLFYVGFFPAFLELSTISLRDVTIVMAVAAVAVGGTKLGYAYMADKAKVFFTSVKARQGMNWVAGGVMIGTGIFLALKT